MTIEEAIREQLKGELLSNASSTRFNSELELDLAVRTIRRRFDEIMCICERMSGSKQVNGQHVENALSWLEHEKSKSTENQIFPQNAIPLTSFVPVSRNHNGLCPLPVREDCLTGAEYVHPDMEPESDLLNIPVTVESLDLVPPRRPLESPEQMVQLKRLKIKQK